VVRFLEFANQTLADATEHARRSTAAQIPPE
jgi:hypothetical protein